MSGRRGNQNTSEISSEVCLASARLERFLSAKGIRDQAFPDWSAKLAPRYSSYHKRRALARAAASRGACEAAVT